MTDHGIARDQLRAFIERIERLEEEKKAISDDIKEVKAEAKGSGFSVPIINEIIKLRKKDANERAEQEALLDIYLHALGMAPDPDGDDDGPRGYRPDEEIDAETGEILVDENADIGEEITSEANETGRFVASTTSESIDAETGEITDTEHEPQPSLMAGAAAAFIPPEVAAGNSENIEITSVESVNEPHMTVAIDANTGGDDVESGASARPAGQETGAQPSGFEDGVEIDLRSGPDPKRASHSQSSDLHDGRLQAVPAPALDESRDSAAGVEAPAAPVNPRCLKHQRGEECKFSHKRYSCAGCNQAAELQRAGAA